MDTSDSKNPELNITPIDDELARQEQEVQAQKDESFAMKIISRRDERVVAFYLIYAADRADYTIDLDVICDDFCKGFGLQLDDHTYPRQVAQGTIEQRDALDERIKPFLKNWKLERLGCCTKLILRLALWELLQPKAISSVVINEAVELAKTFAEKDAYKFVNGILDEIYQKTIAIDA
ncbi:MAG: transcription antitermination factor NusB [Candidatus Babeliales bacterium]|jgi:N utilization substance protein B